MFLVNVEKCLTLFKQVYVSSDSPEILKQAEAVGAIPIYRGAELCGDTPNIPVYQHALEQMGDVDGIVAVQANSPSIKRTLISLASELLLMEVKEVMTCHQDYSIYGSIWAINAKRLREYGDPYNPKPTILLVDNSIDIHTEEDLWKAKLQSSQK